MGHSVSTEMFAGALHARGTDPLPTPERLLQANI